MYRDVYDEMSVEDLEKLKARVEEALDRKRDKLQATPEGDYDEMSDFIEKFPPGLPKMRR